MNKSIMVSIVQSINESIMSQSSYKPFNHHELTLRESGESDQICGGSCKSTSQSLSQSLGSHHPLSEGMLTNLRVNHWSYSQSSEIYIFSQNRSSYTLVFHRMRIMLTL